MTYQEAITHFKTQKALAEKLGVGQSCIANWKKRGKIPRLAQFEIQKLTRGRLKVD